MQKFKINGLYKTGFILLMVCIALLIAAIIVAYLLGIPKLSAVFSVGGAFLAFLGIIFVMLSKPKKEKPVQSITEIQEENSTETQKEISVDNSV